jgi:hypothetical protein
MYLPWTLEYYEWGDEGGEVDFLLMIGFDNFVGTNSIRPLFGSGRMLFVPTKLKSTQSPNNQTIN